MAADAFRTRAAGRLSGLIKLAAAATITSRPIAVRPPTQRTEAVDSDIAPALEAANLQLEELRRRLDDRDIQVDRLKADVVTARREGEAAGRVGGRKEADDRANARLAALEAGIAAAMISLTSELAEMERLAVLLARDCLDKLLGAENGRASLVVDLIRHQVTMIEDRSVLDVSVSGHDFTADTVAAAGAADGAERSYDVSIDHALPPGGCRMRLRLGTLTVGIDQQWGVLHAALTAMADATASAR